MISRMLIMLVFVGGVIGGVYLLKQRQAQAAEKAMKGMRPPAAVVTATEAKKESWQPKVQAVGSLAPVLGTDVTTEVGGLVQSVAFRSGDDVKKGAELVHLVSDTEEAQLRQLEASLDLAHVVLKRDQAQLEARAVSQATLDGDLADVKMKQAQVAQQKALIAKKSIRTPFGGRLGITSVNPGDYLHPGDKIVTLQALDSIYADFYVPQKEIAKLALGQAVDVTTDAYPGRVFHGKITALSPKVEIDTRNILVEATLQNPKHELLPGMFASAEVLAGEPVSYVTLPNTVVSYNPYGDTVFVVETKENGQGGKTRTAKQVFVKVGPTRGDQVAILHGVKPGDLVVTSGQLKLRNGSEVKINNKVQPTDNPAPTPEDK